MKKIILTYILIFSFLLGIGQTIDSKQDSLPTSLHLFYEIDFSGAIRLYKQMIAFDPTNAEFYYKLGIAYLHTKGKADSALSQFLTASDLFRPRDRKKISKTALQFYKAYAYYLTNNLDSAVRILQHLDQEEYLPDDFLLIVGDLLDSIDQKVDNFVEVTNLGKNINSLYTEHSPIYDKDNQLLLFTSRRKVDKNSVLYKDQQYDENIFYSEYNTITDQWSPARPVKVVDTLFNEASCSLNPDNKILILYKDDGNGNLYWAKLINGRWTKLHKFPRPINTNNSENHGSITSDGKILYFSSDRPGGFGGMDIWMTKLQNDGTWTKPINLGPNINTAADEDAPYITPDGKHLYFASNGHNSLGGYDIFVSEKDEFGQWGQAQGLPYPINTIYDDIFFYPVDSSTAFFASNRPGGLGNADIYKVEFRYLKKDYQVNICHLAGFTKPNNLIVKIKDKITGAEYFAKPDEKGKFIFLTKPYHEYNLLIQNPYNGETLFKENLNIKSSDYILQRQINLKKLPPTSDK